MSVCLALQPGKDGVAALGGIKEVDAGDGRNGQLAVIRVVEVKGESALPELVAAVKVELVDHAQLCGAQIGAVAGDLKGRVDAHDNVVDLHETVFVDAQIVDALIGGAAGHAVIYIGAPLSGGVAGHGVPLRRDAGGHVVFPAVFVHGVHGLVAAAEAVLIDAGLKAHDVPETVERATGAEASVPETAEDVDVLHRAVRGQKEHIGAEILSAGADENVLIVAVAPGHGVFRIIREAVGSAVGLAVREIPRLALGKGDRYAVIGEPGGHESVLGLRAAVCPVAGAGLHEHRLIISSVAPRDRGDRLEGGEGAVPVGAEPGEIQREVFLRHRPGPECRQINGDAAVVFILR